MGETPLDVGGATGAGMTSAELQSQIFRYASDLNDLMTQHSVLQRRYRTAAHMMASGDQANDALVNAVRHGAEAFFVTDNLGEVTFANPAARKLLPPPRAGERPLHVWQMCHVSAVSSINAVLAKVSGTRKSDAIEQRRWMLFDRAPGGPWDVLVIPVKRFDQSEIYWVFGSALSPMSPGVETQVRLLGPHRCSEGLMITDKDAVIRYVNAAFSRITFRSEAEVIGQNARILSARRHTPEFYDVLWSQVLESGSWTGELYNRRGSGQIYTEWKTIKAVRNEAGDVLSYVGAFYDLSSRASEHDELLRLANHDALTGLPNRRLLDDRLTQALAMASRSGDNLFVMLLDLDKFKCINDQYGHDIGDQVLRVVGSRMTSCLRDSDTVARIGGDEFVIVLHSPARAINAESIASTLLQSISAPIDLHGHMHTVRASIGCARFPQDGQDAAALLKCADLAMFGAKRFGLEFSFFDSGGDRSAPEDLGFEVWQALTRQELSLLYQPMISTGEGQALLGCEVLLRWRHHRHGNMPPVLFVPIAEKNGAMQAIGRWVFRTALEQLRGWQDKGVPPLRISIHVGQSQLQDANFFGYVMRWLNEFGISPDRLEIEIRESDAAQCLASPSPSLHRLREQGVRVAMVEFGAQDLGLEQLHTLNIDRLRISHHLVKGLPQGPTAKALSQCLVGIGSAFGIEITAAGVEQSEQMRWLAERGCGQVQGNLIGAPMTGEEFGKWAEVRSPVDLSND